MAQDSGWGCCLLLGSRQWLRRKGAGVAAVVRKAAHLRGRASTGELEDLLTPRQAVRTGAVAPLRISRRAAQTPVESEHGTQRRRRSLWQRTGAASTSTVSRIAIKCTRMRYVPVAAGREQTVLLASARRMKRIATACKVARDK